MERDVLKHIFGDAEDLQTLCLEFFMAFSRFEFALKENGYLRAGRHGEALPDWTRFVERNARSYRMCTSARDLMNAPPAQQIVEDGALIWKPVSFEREASELGAVVRLVKTIRNNLFHGGKHGVEDWDNRERTRFLLERGVDVVDSLAQLGDFIEDYERRY